MACRAAWLVIFLACGAFAENICYNQAISSNNFKYTRVTIPGALHVVSVNVASQQSKSACIPGQTYGMIGPVVFVVSGCRAIFRICYERGNTITLGCNSNNYKETICNAGAPIRELTLYNHISKSPCIQGFSYSKSGNFIVVNKGCRADFLVGF